jgi:hypothetical protein
VNRSAPDGVERGMRTETDSTGERATIRDAEVVGWRRRQLIAAGFSLAASDELARNCGIDLHALIALVGRGCPPALAARILAPLEHETRSC